MDDGPHEHLKDFFTELKEGEQLAYTCAKVDGRSIDKVENALVFMQQPPINSDLKASYRHGADEFLITGTGADTFNSVHFEFDIDKDSSSYYDIVDEEFLE